MNSLLRSASLLFILIYSSITAAQDSNIVIAEGSEAVICGKIVIVDALWMSEGVIKADISILEKQNSKPITGGYKKGDEITITSVQGCTYYIYSIVKNGSVNSKGAATLSIFPPSVNIEETKDLIILEEFSSYKTGGYDWYVSSIRKEGNGNTANIIVTQNTVLAEELMLNKEDMIWLGDRLYSVITIQRRSEFVKTDPEKIYEPLPGKIELKAVDKYLNEK